MSDSALPADELDRIADFPWEVLEYLAWLRQQPSTRENASSYLFDEPAVRFRVTEVDVLVCERDLQVEVAPSGSLRLASSRAPAGVVIDGLGAAERELVRGVLGALDGNAPLATLRAELGAAAQRVLDRLLSAAFGKLIFAPLSILEAERAISGVEITRFPGSPYEIGRSYWKNMGAVRACSDALFEALGDDATFERELRKLHVIALMGVDLQNYYQPASPISSGRAAPGRLMRTPVELVESREATVFVSGPRVNAAPVGGAHYLTLLYASLDEPEAALQRRFVDETGLDWGRVVTARAAEDASPGDWFCPPRPLLADHFRALRGSLERAQRAGAADRSACVRALAAFHRDFVRLHPFHCGNQSLAMNLVNRVARAAFGAGLPHLLLDHLAFRLSPEAYARVFARAIEAYVDPQPTPAARYLRLASNRTRTFALVRQLAAAPSLDGARDLVRADPVAAKLLLLDV